MKNSTHQHAKSRSNSRDGGKPPPVVNRVAFGTCIPKDIIPKTRELSNTRKKCCQDGRERMHVERTRISSACTQGSKRYVGDTSPSHVNEEEKEYRNAKQYRQSHEDMFLFENLARIRNAISRNEEIKDHVLTSISRLTNVPGTCKDYDHGTPVDKGVSSRNLLLRSRQRSTDADRCLKTRIQDINMNTVPQRLSKVAEWISEKNQGWISEKAEHQQRLCELCEKKDAFDTYAEALKEPREANTTTEEECADEDVTNSLSATLYMLIFPVYCMLCESSIFIYYMYASLIGFLVWFGVSYSTFTVLKVYGPYAAFGLILLVLLLPYVYIYVEYQKLKYKPIPGGKYLDEITIDYL